MLVQGIASCFTENLLLVHAHSTLSVQLVYRNLLWACASRKLFGQESPVFDKMHEVLTSSVSNKKCLWLYLGVPTKCTGFCSTM